MAYKYILKHDEDPPCGWIRGPAVELTASQLDEAFDTLDENGIIGGEHIKAQPSGQKFVFWHIPEVDAETVAGIIIGAAKF